MRFIILASVFALGCTTGSAPLDTALPVESASSEAQLRGLIGENPRRGQLVVTSDTLYLRLQRGERSTPFLSFSRRTHELACRSPHHANFDLDATGQQDVWWLFTSDDGDAVALQLTTAVATIWFWDPARDCAVAVGFMEELSSGRLPPQRYYKADDAQVAYRWNHNFGHFSAAPLPEEATSGITDGGDGDVLPDVPGVETMIVESDTIAIVAADGRVLLHEDLPIDPDWPCYRAELTLFREADDGLYAVASFETFGTFANCRAVGGDRRFVNVFLDWDSTTGTFVRAYRIRSEVRIIHPDREFTSFDLEQDFPVDHATLQVRWQTTQSYSQDPDATCIDVTKRASFGLITADGARIDLGTASADRRDDSESCER